MRKYLLVPLAVSLLFLTNTYGQKKVESQIPPHAGPTRGGVGVCADQPGQTVVAQGGTYRFRQLGETIEISLRATACRQALPIVSRWRWSCTGPTGETMAATSM